MFNKFRERIRTVRAFRALDFLEDQYVGKFDDRSSRIADLIIVLRELVEEAQA